MLLHSGPYKVTKTVACRVISTLSVFTPRPTCSAAGASRHSALHGGEFEEDGGSNAVPAGAALQQRGQNVKIWSWNTCLSICPCLFSFCLSFFLHHTNICCPTPAGGRNHLHGYQTSHIHAPALRFLHRGRGVADQPAHLFGAAALRQTLRPGGGPPAAAAHRAESGGQVRLPNTLCTSKLRRKYVSV